MRTIYCFAIVALLTISVRAASPNVVVHAQFVELTGDVKSQKEVLKIAQEKGAGVLTAPDFKARSGKPTKISLTRDFAQPGKVIFTQDSAAAEKGAPSIGVALTVRPTLNGSNCDYSVDYEYTDFNGFGFSPARRFPRYTVRKGFGLEGSGGIGETVVLELSPQDETSHRKIFAVLRFTKV